MRRRACASEPEGLHNTPVRASPKDMVLALLVAPAAYQVADGSQLTVGVRLWKIIVQG
jgi:hypothetical protein